MLWHVKASRPGFSATYVCDTPEAALERVGYFDGRGYQTVTIIRPNGTTTTLGEVKAEMAANCAAAFSPVPVEV